MTLIPGQRGTVTLEFMMHAGMDGQHDFQMNLWTNDPEMPFTELRVRSNWVP